MRLFIAVQLNDTMRDALGSVQSFLRRHGVRGNFTRAENLHLTLAFVGEYAHPEAVAEVLETVRFTPFPMRLDGFGHFGRLYWIGVNGGEALPACARRLRRALAQEGVPFDRKKFSPHITLMRQASLEGDAAFPGVVIPEASMEVRALSLMRSDRGKGGMVYTEIARVSAE